MSDTNLFCLTFLFTFIEINSHRKEGLKIENNARLGPKKTIRFKRDTIKKLELDAKKYNESVSQIVRNIVENHYLKDAADDGLEVVEKALKRVMNPYIDRLSELSAHTAIASGMSAWLIRSLIKELTYVDTEDAWNKSYALSAVCLKGEQWKCRG